MKTEVCDTITAVHGEFLGQVINEDFFVRLLAKLTEALPGCDSRILPADWKSGSVQTRVDHDGDTIITTMTGGQTIMAVA
jgi:hypothetical protein